MNVTWPAENSRQGEPSRCLSRLLLMDIYRGGEIAVRAQHLAKVRAMSEGKTWARVNMADLLGGVLCAGDEFLPKGE